jgi:hypothetical protein
MYYEHRGGIVWLDFERKLCMKLLAGAATHNLFALNIMPQRRIMWLPADSIKVICMADSESKCCCWHCSVQFAWNTLVKGNRQWRWAYVLL